MGDEAPSHGGARWTPVSQLAAGPEKPRCELGLGRQTEPSPHFRTGQGQTNARVPRVNQGLHDRWAQELKQRTGGTMPKVPARVMPA